MKTPPDPTARQHGEARRAAEQARVAAEEARKRRQEEEALRLLREAEARAVAVAEKAAREAEAQAALDAELGKLRMVLDFRGFHPKFGRDGIARDLVFAEVAPLVRSAGYEIVTRGQVHDAGYRWTDVRLMAYWLAINENSATGLYSYRASLVLPKEMLKLSLTTAMDSARCGIG